jgi:hypothetical protein
MRPNLAKSKSASDNRKLAAILGHLGSPPPPSPICSFLSQPLARACVAPCFFLHGFFYLFLNDFFTDNVEASLAKSGKGSSKGAGDDLSAYRKAPVVIRARTPNVHAENKVCCAAARTARGVHCCLCGTALPAPPHAPPRTWTLCARVMPSSPPSSCRHVTSATRQIRKHLLYYY